MLDKGNAANYPVHGNPPPNMPSVEGSYPQAPPYTPPGYGEPGPAYPPQGGMNPQPYPPPYYPPYATTMPTNPDGTPHQMPCAPTAPAAHLPNTMPHGAPQYNITSGIQGPAPPIHTTTVVTTVPQNTVYLSVAYHDVPVATVCKFCNHQIVTRTAYAVGGLAWLICAILILLGCWAGCCLIPFCIDGCKDVNHFCPNCNQLIHRYKRL